MKQSDRCGLKGAEHEAAGGWDCGSVAGDDGSNPVLAATVLPGHISRDK